MKEINMTKAISCMPDKFITMEMVELAATEHRPELVNYLPEKYITSEILDSIFKTDDYGWRSWQLSKIPEEKRNRQICLRAIKAEKSNFPDIPEKYRNSDILESLFAHRNFMHYLHLIPSSSWNNGTVRDAIYSLYRDVQQNGGYRYCSERYEQQFLYETSVMLSFVPRQAKDFRLWKELIHDGRIATMTIDKMMPKCFKQAAYYKEWAIRCIKEVDTRWLDYEPYGRPSVTRQATCMAFSIHTDITSGSPNMRMMPWLTKQWSWNLTCLTNFPDGSGHRKDLFIHLK